MSDDQLLKRRGAPIGNTNARKGARAPMTSITLKNHRQLEKFRALGGSRWLQGVIDAAPLESSDNKRPIDAWIEAHLLGANGAL